MNQTAKKMWRSATYVGTPHGLPNPGTYSSARDLSALARHLIHDFPKLYTGFDTTKQFTYNNITQKNRNLLLWRDPSVDGLNTGPSQTAGHCPVSSAPHIRTRASRGKVWSYRVNSG